MYAIATYLTLEARQEAVRHVYKLVWVDSDDEMPTLRDSDRCCPLGVALTTMKPALGHKSPTARDVARAFREQGTGGAVHESALTFITDWEAGRIPDLAAALGVEAAE